MAPHQQIAIVVFRVVLPIILGLCSAMRFSLTSMVYFVMLLICPILPSPDARSMNGHTGRFLKSLGIIGIINFVIQLIFQIVLLSLPPYGGFLKNCTLEEKLLRHIGLIRLDNINEEDGTRWLLPECLMIVVGSGIYFLCRRLIQLQASTDARNVNEVINQPPPDKLGNICLRILNAIGTHVALILLGLAGIICPSLTSAVYFLIFLGGATYWSLNNSLGRRFGLICRGITVMSVCHVFLLYVYQFQWVQEAIPPTSVSARVFGFTALQDVRCYNDTRTFHMSTPTQSRYLNPLFLLLLYYFLWFEVKFLLSDKAQPVDEEMPLTPYTAFSSPSEPASDSNFNALNSRTSSLRSSFNAKNYFVFNNTNNSLNRPSSGRALSISGGHRDNRRRGTSFKSVQLMARPEKRHSLQVPNALTISEEREEVTLGNLLDRKDQKNHRLHNVVHREQEEDEEDNPLQRLISPLIMIFQVVIRSSYIATNIVMMAWSITYHSWLTFVLLLWACVLWMIPNQRSAMLKCSPFLVFYAEILLILQYIYCMDLDETELPSKLIKTSNSTGAEETSTINLDQVGLSKYKDEPVKPLLAKVLYTCMFWITLRQYVQEILATQSQMNAAAAFQPFTVAITTTSGQSIPARAPADSLSSTGPLMGKIGQWVKNCMVKFWIWLVAINLFAFGIHGTEVVLFRVMYMVFFLIFLITFQVSYSAWRKFLYGFWLTIIIYQMIVLVLTYIHQFDHVPEYWKLYLNVEIQLQKNIGLEYFETGRLFIKLLTPTFFVIVTIIQVHYFHKDFLQISDIEAKPEETDVQDKKKIPDKKPKKTECPHLLDSCTLRDIKDFLMFVFGFVTERIIDILATVNDLFWRFLEIHINKIVLGSIMCLACYDVCAFHWTFALLASIAVPCPERVQRIICRACVVITSILLIIRMIYQISYIDEHRISVNCTDQYPDWAFPYDYAVNTTSWLGLRKTKALTKYLKGYIGIIVVISIQTVVAIRTDYRRLVKGIHPSPVLFPNVTRAQADDGLLQCLQFLFNYGFYKFGLEICLMSIVGVIGTRLDFYSLYYAGWLCYFFKKRRGEIAKYWKWFVFSITGIIPFQYLMCVGLPPTVCYNYPWETEMLVDEEYVRSPNLWIWELREWTYLPDFVRPPEHYKIVTDFCLLVFAVCQQKVFEIELGEDNEQYEGGSNREIVYDDMASLVNPIPDFITYSRTFLDKIKVAIFFSSYWVTLAVMFLTGTNRTTLFAMGYVLGSFVFLWQGNEFYLRPLSTILKLWNFLLGYNVSVIVIKSFLQFLGCAFLKQLAINACWFVQLFGIACVKKFGDNTDDAMVTVVKDSCTVPKSEAGLLWDGICFGWLLMQRRLFQSFYFQHLVTEMKGQTELASRGAELIFELMQKEIAEQQAAEKEVINKLKEKMDQIKATQIKMSENARRDNSQCHYDANTLEHFSETSTPLPMELSSPPPQVSLQGSHYPRGVPANLSATPGIPTPSSANLTISLDGYMEPARLSLSCTPFTPFQQPITSPSDDSFPVFSPPPYHTIRGRVGAVTRSTSHPGADIGPPWLKEQMKDQLDKHRPSISTLSPLSHHTSIRSGDYYMFADCEEDLTLDQTRDSPSPEEDPGGLTVSELLSTAMRTDIEFAVEEARLARMSEFDNAVSSRRSSFRKKPMSRTYSGRSQLSARSALSQGSRTSRATSRSVRIHERPRSPPEVPHSPLPLIADSILRRSSLTRPTPPTSLPPLPPLPPVGSPSREGSYWGVDDSTMHDYSEIEPKESKGAARILRKVVHYLNFAWEFMESVMISITLQLNRFSKDYRYVSACLSIEKRRLKETEGFSAIPVAPAIISSSQQDLFSDEKSREKRQKERKKRRNEKRKAEKEKESKQSAYYSCYSSASAAERRRAFEIRIEKGSEDMAEDSVDFFELPPDAQGQQKDHSPFVRLCVAIWYSIISRSELVSYIMIFVNMIKSASVLALPLPFMVFLWGSLSVPRPSKTFWICIIAYTEVIVMIKCLFQFEFFPWNAQKLVSQPFWPPRIIGVEQKDKYAVYDLGLLLVVFFHRFMLKSLGLWKKSDANEPNEKEEILEDGYPVEPFVAPEDSVANRTSTSSSPTPSKAFIQTSSVINGSEKNKKLERIERESHLDPDEEEQEDSSTDEEMLISHQTGDETLAGSPIKDTSSFSFENKVRSAASLSKDSSTATNSALSLIQADESPTLTSGSEEEFFSQQDTLLTVSEIHYTKPYLESHLDDIIMTESLISGNESAYSNFPTFSSTELHFSTSSTKSGLAIIQRTPENAELSKKLEKVHLRNPSEVSFHKSHSPGEGRILSREPSADSQKQLITPRKDSLMVYPPIHRRGSSFGSKVSFLETISDIPENRRRVSIYHHSYGTQSIVSKSSDTSSGNFNCHNFNLRRLREIRRPNIHEVKDNIRKLPIMAKEWARRGKESLLSFIADLLNPKHQVPVNVYTYLFICDFCNFFVLITGFSAFGTQTGDGGVRAYLEENRVPIPFLIMIMLQFGLMMIDRALFLKKYLLGMVIFQISITFGIHIWMFMVLPAITDREFNAKKPPQAFYMIKCIYLLLAAYQIRSGYPTRILGNFFCKDYNVVNIISFKIFMFIPFLYELRTIMDWIWTKTSMSLSDWIKMEDIFVRIFLLKCERRLEDRYPQERGKGKRKLIKYGMGGMALLGVVGLIWFPLIFFALSSSVGESNPPNEVTLEITIGSYQPVFKMTTIQQDMHTLSLADWEKVNKKYSTDPTAQTFLNNYDNTDVVVAHLNGNSTAMWGISPPAQYQMIKELKGHHPIKIKAKWYVKRPAKTAQVKEVSTGESETALKPDEDSKDREILASILTGNFSNNPVRIKNLLPKFLKITNKGSATYVKKLSSQNKELDGMIDLNFTLLSGEFKTLTSAQEFWRVEEDCSKVNFNWLPKSKGCMMLTIYTFSDKAAPESFSFVSSRGIMGVYSSIILMVSKLLRMHFSDMSTTIMFDDMPNVDRILQLCLDIYLVRESGELELEEDLFAKLIFLFRSPETLIKWTRLKEEEDMLEDEKAQ